MARKRGLDAETLSGRTFDFESLVSTAPLPELVRITALEAANIAFGFLFGSRLAANWGMRK